MYVFQPPSDWNAWTLMAIMQSRLFLFLYRTANQGESRVIPQVKASKLEGLPVPSCPSSHPISQSLLNLANQMLPSKAVLAKAQTDKDRNYYEAKCAALDRQIDTLVYQLYGLTADEIAIVEGTKE